MTLNKIMLKGFGKEGGGDIQFVDYAAIENDHRAAAERGELDPEKVNARIEKLAKEYEEKKKARMEKGEESGDKNSSDIFNSELNRLSEEYNKASTIEEQKKAADRMTEFLSINLGIKFARKRMSAVETSKNT